MKREGDGVLLEVIAVLTPTTSSCDEQEGDDDDDNDDEEGDEDDEEIEDTFVLLLFSITDETAGCLLRCEKISPPLWGRRRG